MTGRILCAGLLLICPLLQSRAPAEEVQTSALSRTMKVYLTDGRSVTGTVVMTGPKAAVLLVDGKELTLPAERIERMEEAQKAPTDSRAVGGEGIMETYKVVPVKGAFVVIEPMEPASSNAEAAPEDEAEKEAKKASPPAAGAKKPRKPANRRQKPAKPAPRKPNARPEVDSLPDDILAPGTKGATPKKNGKKRGSNAEK